MIPVSLALIVALERLHVYPMRIIDFFFNIFLVYYYLTLSLREHILRVCNTSFISTENAEMFQVNGSNIARWWTLHHTFSLAMTLVMLTWPYSRFFIEFRFHFYLFSAYLCMILGHCVMKQLMNACSCGAIATDSISDGTTVPAAKLRTSKRCRCCWFWCVRTMW